MPFDPRHSVAGILAKLPSVSQPFEGTAFLVQGGLLVTCSHVLKDARRNDAGQVECLFYGQEKRTFAEVVLNSPERDLAVLRPLSLPEGVVPLSVAPSASAENREFESLGYRQTSDFPVQVAQGKIYRIIHNTKGHAFLQLSSFEVAPGFSGGPVLDSKSHIVVGIISSGVPEEPEPDKRGRSFAIVTETLQFLYPELEFTSLPKGIDKFYIPPDSVFEDIRIQDFIGRDWLTVEVDTFLEEHKSGAFLLTGEAGVGKTAFMAHLVKERGYLHIFSKNNTNVQSALCYLGAQLISHYHIDAYNDPDTLVQLAAFPDFLERLLRLAADQRKDGEKIVIVCDALDEAGTFPDGYVLGLPNSLPDGVYFILTQRPVNTKLPNIITVTEKLDPLGLGNQQDMQDYLEVVAKRPEVAEQLRAKSYSKAFFVETLKEKSLGIWMYLHYIVREIESGLRTPLDLQALPTGLVGYYADYWDDWRNGRRNRGEGKKKWHELYAPLLATLAAAQEPITVAQLRKWAGVNAPEYEVRDLLREDWAAFITERDGPESKVYAPYHLSFRDFVTGKVDLDALTSPAHQSLVRDLSEQTLEAHRRIIQDFK